LTGGFFFRAEDGIRDFHVTGVQTCALPISKCGVLCSCFSVICERMEGRLCPRPILGNEKTSGADKYKKPCASAYEKMKRNGLLRSEERRVGKEYRFVMKTDHDRERGMTREV